MNWKGMIYKGLKISNDINAINKNKVPQRVGRSIIGAQLGKLLGKLFK